MTRHLNLISLYTGAGGLDFGFEAAGFKTRACIEIDNDCISTIRENRHWPIINNDISNIPAAEILDVAGLKADEVDIIIGGPPCQPFSKAGYWANGDTKRLSDYRANTLHEFMRCVNDILPTVFLLENVHGINYSGKEEGFRLLFSLTNMINKKNGTDYKLSWRVLNSADYGVPQLRHRFFLVAHKYGTIFNFPTKTHDKLGSHLKHYITAWDAVGHLSADTNGEDLSVKGKWGGLLPSIPEGENYLWHTDRKGGLPLFGWRTRYWSFLLKLAKNQPSWTIQAQPGPAIGPFHWENRRLSIKEMAAIQTFPQKLNFIGSRVSIQKQLGNAVPSLLAEVLAREIAKQFFEKTFKKRPKLAVEAKKHIPPPEPAAKVPQKYLSLAGNHPPHPGTGKGNNAKKNLMQSHLRF